jgi:hypothetical protein
LLTGFKETGKLVYGAKEAFFKKNSNFSGSNSTTEGEPTQNGRKHWETYVFN